MKTSFRGNNNDVAMRCCCASFKCDGGFALLHSLFVMIAVCGVIVFASSYINTKSRHAEKLQDEFYVQLAEKNETTLELYETR